MPETVMGAPTPPIPFGDNTAKIGDHFTTTRIIPTPQLLQAIAATGARVMTGDNEIAEASRDWWPLAMTWAKNNEVGVRAGAVVCPTTNEQIADVLVLCNQARVPVTAAAGRSGVSGASIPIYGGIVLDLTGITGIISVDRDSMIVDVFAGTFGNLLEETLRRDYNCTLGHWPQSIDLSTVGGWLACRGAGQFSTRYGKIEDMVIGLDAILADGRTITTGGAPRAASGPDLTQLFVGSEGTLGVITSARLRLHPAPAAERRAAFAFPTFSAGLDACRRIMQRGATPAVLRLYDAIEGDRHFSTGPDLHPLLVMDEGDPLIIDAVMEVVAQECAGAEVLDGESLLEQWLAHRNDVSSLEALISIDYVVDTMEISARWNALDAIYENARAAISAVSGTAQVSAHQSHAYSDGACLYFTFAAKPEDKEQYYRNVWDAGTNAVLAAGGSLSHHHGVGLNRARFMRSALGSGLDVLAEIKTALDPNGILNPGKLGLASEFGAAPSWP